MSDLEVRFPEPRKLQVVKSKCFRISSNAPWYVSNRQIHENLGMPFFAYHIRALIENFDSKSADAGNPLCSATWKARVPTKGWQKSPTGNLGGLLLSRLAEAVPKKAAGAAQQVVSNYSAALTEIFRAFPQL
jgi:hypothetical protein